MKNSFLTYGRPDPGEHVATHTLNNIEIRVYRTIAGFEAHTKSGCSGKGLTIEETFLSLE